MASHWAAFVTLFCAYSVCLPSTLLETGASWSCPAPHSRKTPVSCVAACLGPPADPPDIIYIGRSHFSHRVWQPITCWLSPFVVGWDESSLRIAFRFLQWLPSSKLASGFQELEGRRLACDCAPMNCAMAKQQSNQRPSTCVMPFLPWCLSGAPR